MQGYPTEITYLGNPLDYLADDNIREREICALVAHLATTDTPANDELEMITTYLIEELPLHQQDENEDLYPLMRKRCHQEDRIDHVIDRMLADYCHAQSDLPAVISALQKAPPFSESARSEIQKFSVHALRHVEVENAIILPIARARLEAHDLDQMLQHMLQRRGLDRLVDVRDAH